MAETFVKVLFTCNRCDQKKVPVEVRPRFAGENIIAFANRVMLRCQSCHRARSPRCQHKKLDLYLPIGAEQMGDAGEPTEERKAEFKEAIKNAPGGAMNRDRCHQICSERFEGWAKKLAGDLSTPALVLGIGHGPKSGQITMVTTEEMSHEHIRGLLRYSLANLSTGSPAGKAIEDRTEPELAALTTAILDGIAEKLPPNCAFTVLFWPIGTHNVAQYGSNCARADMIKALRETADRLERRQDVPR